MKKRYVVWMVLLVVSVMLAAFPGAAETYVENGGKIPDPNTYQGDWHQTYIRILDNHAGRILEYETRNIEYWNELGHQVLQCRPIELEDLNADGVPELIFMEAAGDRGDLYIYSWSGNAADCKLYVPGITRLDYDEMLGFLIYRSAYGGDTLVIEYYDYEWPWLLQFNRNAFGQYTLSNYLNAEYDNSGEEADRYFLNGQQIPEKDYSAMLDGIRNAKTWNVSGYMSENDRTYGFTYSWESAMAELQGTVPATPDSGTAGPAGSNDIYGYTIDKLATRKGPSTTYDGGGTYNVKNQWIKVLAKAWDKRNSIWWVKCEIPYHGEIRVLWTGYKRFDQSTLPLDQLPEEVW